MTERRTDADLRALLGSRRWYHTIELRPGIVTPGWFDLRGLVPSLPIPADMTGQRALDVGTFEGFWAMQMESRGADVTAIDILDPRQWDWPVGSDDHVLAVLNERKQSGDGFTVVAEELGSAVKRLELSVYDLDPASVGVFDFVYVGSLLLHLRDPVRALERVGSVLAPGGQLLLVDAVDVELSLLHRNRAVAHFDGDGRPWWWLPNIAALRRFVEAAGFRIERGPTKVYMPLGTGHDPLAKVRSRTLLGAAGRRDAATRRRGGEPHAWILASSRLR
jgi:tRNA (mo5U34)-methyltransferase